MIMAAKTCFITGAARGFGHLRAEAALVWRDNSGLIDPFSWLSPIPSSPTPVEQHNLQYWRLRHRLRLMLSISECHKRGFPDDGGKLFFFFTFSGASILRLSFYKDFEMSIIYVVVLTYIKPLEDVDSQLPDHVEWLKKGYSDGVFLTSGRRIPRNGGVILAKCDSLESLEARLSQDPFQKFNIAKAEIIPFEATMKATLLENIF